MLFLGCQHVSQHKKLSQNVYSASFTELVIFLYFSFSNYSWSDLKKHCFIGVHIAYTVNVTGFTGFKFTSLLLLRKCEFSCSCPRILLSFLCWAILNYCSHADQPLPTLLRTHSWHQLTQLQGVLPLSETTFEETQSQHCWLFSLIVSLSSLWHHDRCICLLYAGGNRATDYDFTNIWGCNVPLRQYVSPNPHVMCLWWRQAPDYMFSECSFDLIFFSGSILCW